MDGSWERLTDAQLCARRTESAQAVEALVRRHRNLVLSCARPFFLTGAESDDLLQEGMLGLLSAASRYDPQRQASFKTFASLCIRRRLISAVRSADAQRHRILNHSIPLCTSTMDTVPQGSGWRLTEQDPEEQLIGAEESAAFWRQLSGLLSPLEQRTVELYLDGLSYQDIADRLQRSTKTVDNAVQRIRRKVMRLQSPGVNGACRSQI